jgi:hypothetical protein
MIRGEERIDPCPARHKACRRRFAMSPPAAGCSGAAPYSGQSRPGPRRAFGARLAGFSLHAATVCEAHQRSRLERLCRCITRPPIATKRLSVDGRGRVVYRYRQPFRDGSTQVGPHRTAARAGSSGCRQAARAPELGAAPQAGVCHAPGHPLLMLRMAQASLSTGSHHKGAGYI